MPTFRTAANRAVTTREVTLAASAARTTTDNGATIDHEGDLVGQFELDVTASTGTPTLNVTIQGLTYDGGEWFTIGTFTQATGITNQTIAVPLAGQKMRARWVIGGGTPNITFSVVGVTRR